MKNQSQNIPNKNSTSPLTVNTTTCERLKSKIDSLVTFEKIGGLNKQITLIENLLLSSSLKNHSIYTKIGKFPPTGILIYGLPGTGKTITINAFKNKYQTSLKFFLVDCKNLLNKNNQDSVSYLNEIFISAIQNAPKSVLVFDDIDFIFPNKKKSHSELEKKLLLQFLSFFDNLIDNKRIVIIGITNNLEDVDQKLRRSKRFDYELEFNVPLFEERLDILKKILNKCNHDLNEKKMIDFSKSLIAYTGADINLIVSFSALNSFENKRDKITLEDLNYSVKLVKPSAMREIKLEVPLVFWSDIGGMYKLKEKLMESLIWPIKYKHIYKKFKEHQPKGILLFGPPGCSKTMIGKALATECKHRFITVKGPEILNKYVGESEKTLRDIFSKARQIAPSIIFFDEIDAIAVNRSIESNSSNSVNDKIVSTFLNELDGIEKLSNVFIVATTNRPDIIDKSLIRTGRIDSIIYVPLPDLKTRKEIFRIKFEKIPVSFSFKKKSKQDNFNDPNLKKNWDLNNCEEFDVKEISDGLNCFDINDDFYLNDLAEKTEGYSGAEITAIFHEAFLIGLKDKLYSDQELMELDFKHYLKAIENVKPRTDQKMIDIYEKFAYQFACY